MRKGRYKCQALLDEHAVLAAMTYVDLNPVRAGMTSALETSDHTTIKRRIEAARTSTAPDDRAPLAAVSGQAQATLPLTQTQYIALVDYTGRQLRPGKRGRIAADAPSAFATLQMPPDRWAIHVNGVGSGNWRAVGATQALLDKAAAMGQRWLKGIGTARALQT